MISGEIGVLYQDDKQVGGIFNWTISASFSHGAVGRWRTTKALKLITARSYWLIEEPKGDIFRAEFYRQIKGQLILMDAGTIKLKLPDTITFDKALSAPLNLKWMGSDD